MTFFVTAELVSALMHNMCRELYRNSRATHDLLKIQLQMMECLWNHPSSTMKANCLIMIKGCLRLCEKLYYPPHVAALVYECVAKAEQLSRQHQEPGNADFRESLLAAAASDAHFIRLYCTYLLKVLAVDYNTSLVQAYASRSLDIFLINVSYSC